MREQTDCRNGHPFTPENTYRHSGKRRCRACGRAAQERQRAKQRAARPEVAVDPFWSQVQATTGGCWEWTGRRGHHGHGMVTGPGGGTRMAHRVAYEQLVSEIPAELVLDHECRNPPCVNPGHLDPVPHAVNTLRGDGITAVNRRKTHCKRGHEFTPDNVLPVRLRSGGTGRQCRACLQEANRRGRARRKALKVEAS